jgi:hypothetical protein
VSTWAPRDALCAWGAWLLELSAQPRKLAEDLVLERRLCSLNRWGLDELGGFFNCSVSRRKSSVYRLTASSGAFDAASSKADCSRIARIDCSSGPLAGIYEAGSTVSTLRILAEPRREN